MQKQARTLLLLGTCWRLVIGSAHVNARLFLLSRALVSKVRFGLMFDPNYFSTIAQFSMAHQQRNATLVFVGWYNARSTDWRCVRSRLRTKLEKRKCAKHFFSVFEGIYGEFTCFSRLGAFEGFVTIFLLKKS